MEYSNSGVSVQQRMGHSFQQAQIAPPPPSSAILMGLSLRVGDVMSLHEALSELEQRLQPLLRPAMPQGVGGSASPVTVQSDVVEQIDRIGQGVTAARTKVTELLERLDV